MSAAPAIWAYRARVERVIDGDTIDLTIDAGFRSTREERVRLLGVNTPEVRGATRQAGVAARTFVEDWLSRVADGDEWPLIVQTHKGDAFGRYLGRIWRRHDGACLNDTLLMAGHAVPFMID